MFENLCLIVQTLGQLGRHYTKLASSHILQINIKPIIYILDIFECTTVPVCQFQCGFPTHSQTEVQSLRRSDVSADLSCLSQDRPLRDVTVSGGMPIK